MATKRKRDVRSSSAVTTTKRKYKRDRCPKKSDAFWKRYRPLLDVLCNTYKCSVKHVRKFIATKHREDLSCRQIQHRMELWGWFRYKTAKRDNASKKPVQAADSPTTADDDSLNSDGSQGGIDEEHQPTQAGRSLGGDDSLAQSPCNVPDAAQPPFPPCPSRTTWSLYHDKQKAFMADLALVIGHRDFAFETYAALCDEIVLSQFPSSTAVYLHIASCLRTASTPYQGRRALGFLDFFQSQRTQAPELELQMSLLRALIEPPGGSSATSLAQVVRDMLDGIDWSDLPRPFTVADLGTWRALMQAVWHARLNEDNTLSYDTSFLKCQPISSWVEDYSRHDPNRPSALLGCLEWTTQQLQYDLKVSPWSQDITIDGTNYHWLNHFILCTSLIEVARRDPPGNEHTSWWSTSELEMSIPPVLLLSTVCHLILDEPPFCQDPKPSLYHVLEPRDPEQPRFLKPGSRAAFAAVELSSRSRDYLWTRFLLKLPDQDEIGLLDKTARGHATRYLESLYPDEEGLDADQTGGVPHGAYDANPHDATDESPFAVQNAQAWEANQMLMEDFNIVEEGYNPPQLTILHGYEMDQEEDEGAFGTSLAGSNIFSQ